MAQRESNRPLYETLVRLHAGGLYRYALRLCGETEAAEDLVQETFYQAWRSIDSLREASRGKAWLFQILRHRYAHEIRDRERSVPTTSGVELINGATSHPGHDVLALLGKRELLQRALEGLDGRYKEPFLLVFADGQSCREAAELLEIPLGTVLSRIHRARMQLRQRLRQLDEDMQSNRDAQTDPG